MRDWHTVIGSVRIDPMRTCSAWPHGVHEDMSRA